MMKMGLRAQPGRSYRSFFNFRLLCSVSLDFLFVFAMVATAGWAAEAKEDLTALSIEDLMEVRIESVSKFDQRLADAPAFVTIVTSDDIKKHGYRNLPDILQSVRGSFVRYDRNYHYLGLRGFSRAGDYNSRFLLLVDGHRMNDNVFDQSAIGNDFILDVDLIDRVEIIRGPSSSLYGTNAFLGTINIRTKKGKDLKGLEVSGEGGTFTTYKGRLSYGNRFESGLEILLSGSRYESQGDQRLYYKEFDSPSTNNGIVKDADDENYGSLFGSLSFGNLSLEGGYIRRQKEIPTAAFETVFNNDDTKTTDARAFGDLKYRHQLPYGVGVQGRVYYDHYYYRGDYIYADSADPSLLVKNIDKAQTQSMGGEVQFGKALFGRHNFILGAEYQYVFKQDQLNYDTSVYVDDRRRSKNWGLYLQDEFEIFKSLRVNAGVRYDHYSSFGGTVNPRVGITYTPFERTILKLLYGQAFRAPNVYELYYQDPGISQKANPNLDPETIRTVEIGMFQYLGFNVWGTMNLYYQRIRDLIAQQEDPKDGLLVFQNIEGVVQKGLELELEGKWTGGFRSRVSYALQRTEDKKTGTGVANSPAHLLKLNGIVPIVSEKLFLGLEGRYSSRRKTLGGAHSGDAFVTNVTLFSQNVIKGIEVSGSVYNLFNNKYSDPGGGEHVQDSIRQDGRSFRFKLTYRF
ncbi:MAG: TonB-dependent receptor [Deltaproteobacteria bacterium]|nr:TonB-dependent receptor [Deltaproteobacteria bacterium]